MTASGDFRLEKKTFQQDMNRPQMHCGSLTSTLGTNFVLPLNAQEGQIDGTVKLNYSTASLNRMRHISLSKCGGTNWPSPDLDWSNTKRPDSTVYATLSRDPKKRLITGKLTLPLRTGSEPPVTRKTSLSGFAATSAAATAAAASAAAAAVDKPESDSSRLARLSGRLTFDTRAAGGGGGGGGIGGVSVPCRAADLRVDRELGQGVCGVVSMATHLPSGRRLAVKAMRLQTTPGWPSTTDGGDGGAGAEERRRVLNDLEVAGKCRDCPHIVQFYGAVLCQSEVWICMELMATCLDRLLRVSGHQGLPEPVLGKVVVPVLRALHYLKERHNLIHRDVKPSNVLLSWRGQVKLCDFGISGQLVNSKAHTRTAGCIAYLAPERITLTSAYDIRSDVWSLGVTLVELATGRHPLAACSCEMELLTRIVDDPPPQLPRVAPGTGATLSDYFRDFVAKCLMKDVNLRPKYQRLLCHDFVKYHEQTQTDLAEWLAELMGRYPDLNAVSTMSVRRRKLSAASSQGSSSGYGSADTNSPSSAQS